MLVVCQINIKIGWWLDSIMQPITRSQSSLGATSRKDGASTHIYIRVLSLLAKKAKCLSPGLPWLPNTITYGWNEKRDRAGGKRRAVKRDAWSEERIVGERRRWWSKALQDTKRHQDNSAFRYDWPHKCFRGKNDNNFRPHFYSVLQSHWSGEFNSFFYVRSSCSNMITGTVMADDVRIINT